MNQSEKKNTTQANLKTENIFICIVVKSVDNKKQRNKKYESYPSKEYQ